MTDTLKFSVEETLPDLHSVLAYQGIASPVQAPARIQDMAEHAIGTLADLAAPVGIISDISVEEFSVVYDGEGHNEPITPVGEIHVRSHALALFAVTMGRAVSDRIGECFAGGDCAGGAMLDAAASAAADGLAAGMEGYFVDTLAQSDSPIRDLGVLRYSPGYCGWHITGQRRLFHYLKPERIGITLNDSCLMQPIKSVSGVLIAGPKEIHVFANSYPFCAECEDEGCRERIRSMLAGR
jgi:hypothetical protein